MTQEKPVWRSVLFVPGNVERFIEKAPSAGADALIVDLEDSIIPSEKEATRAKVAQTAERLARDDTDVLVRINRPWRLAVRDIEACVSPQVKALACPKIADASHVRFIAELLDELEHERGLPRGHTRIVAMIETTDALFHAREIAGASPRVVGMICGSEDFALDAGMAPEPDGLYHATMHIAHAARAAGVMQLGFLGSIAQFRDQDAFRALIRRSRALGFEGAFCIHPTQVPILNEEYGPKPEEIAYAKKVLDAWAKATAEGRGSVQVDGRMIDIPIVDRAERLLARAAAIEARTKARART